MKRNSAAFSTVELVGAVLLFSIATAGVLTMGKAMRDHRMAMISTGEQNSYSTFQSQIALQGINPTLVANPMGGAINENARISGAITAGGTNLAATFETGAVSQPAGAQRNLGGSARVDALNYSATAAGNQATRGIGIGFAIETSGPAPPSGANAIQLAPPSFTISGDLTNATFPLNNIATLPSSNPPGTVYRYTTDGSTPTGDSQVWDNNPDWTPASFPAQVTLQAFNPDPQYAPSPAVTASYSMQLNVTYARADGRVDNPYGFNLSDLAAPGVTGIVLNGNVAGFDILYTLDGSDPTVSPTATLYSGAFAPLQSQFTPTVALRVAAVSNDPRINSSPTTTYNLDTIAAPLAAPSFITSNAAPLTPGTDVVIGMNGSGGSPRTEVNNGAPTQSSSTGTSFPLN
jgi:hypothetical protein